MVLLSPVFFHFFLCQLKSLINQAFPDQASINDIFSLFKNTLPMLISFSEITLNFFQLCRTYFWENNSFGFLVSTRETRDQLYREL